MAADTLDFTFNTGLFEKGIDRVMGGFRNMENTAGAVSRGINKSLRRVAAVAAGLFGSFKLIQGALKNMPEVGQAFGIARDIFVKNLLFPLRKEILPLLQRMLDWVRDNRAAFVRWGNAIANIFRSVVRGVRNVLEFIRQMSQRIAEFSGRIFGEQIENIDDIFNLITFKLSVVIQFVTNLLSGIRNLFDSFLGGLGDDISEDLNGIVDSFRQLYLIFTTTNEQGHSFSNILNNMFELFGKISGFIIAMTDSFLQGFVPEIENIATPLQRISDTFEKIFDSIFFSTESMKSWEGIFRDLGSFLGGSLMAGLNAVAFVLEQINIAGDWVDVWINRALEWYNRAGPGAQSQVRNLSDIDVESELAGSPDVRTRLRLPGREVQDAILRPDGSVIQTDPRDTLVAIKDPAESFRGLGASGGTRNFDVTVDLTGMNIVLQQGGQEQGQAFAQGLVEQIRFAWNQEFERFGA